MVLGWVLAKRSSGCYGRQGLRHAMSYQDFLASKSTAAPVAGFDPERFTAPLFPFQRDIVTMACRVGKFCIWADL